MNCRRCNRPHRQLAHFHNDLFDGWFCPMCVDVLIDAALVTPVSVPYTGNEKPHVDSEGRP